MSRPTGDGIGTEVTAHGWKVFDARAPILTCAYSFGPGTANALARVRVARTTTGYVRKRTEFCGTSA